MSEALPARPSLAWLRKTAKQRLRDLQTQRPEAKLAEAQFAIARQYGFSSWRSLKTHIDGLYRHPGLAGGPPLTDEDIAIF